MDEGTLLSIEGLKTYFFTEDGIVKSLDGISLKISIVRSEDNRGVVVTKINDSESKLNIGDIITEVNREKINDPENFVLIIENIKGTGRSSLLLKIIREKESLWITIKFRDN